MEIGDVITTGRGDQASNVRLLPVENASTDGAEASTPADGDAGVPEDAANEEPWAAGIRGHLERRGRTQGELASRSSLKPNTLGAVLRCDPTSTRTLTAIVDSTDPGDFKAYLPPLPTADSAATPGRRLRSR